jgi:molecular chaperone Hsp33
MRASTGCVAMTEDYLRKFLFDDLPVKGSLVRLSKSWQDVILRAQPCPETQDLLGETLCASVLLTSNIKFCGSVSLQIQSTGRVRLLLGQCTHTGSIRGVVRAAHNPGSTLLEQGVLSINLEPDREGAPYQGIVNMPAGGLVSALERYFLQSEQIETRFWLVADSFECNGLMLQRLPGETEDADGWNRLQHIAASVTNGELKAWEPEELLGKLFPEDNIRLFDAKPVQFGCSCSLQKVSGVLHSLGQEDILKLIEERGIVEVRCEYCGQNYEFDPVDIAALFVGSPAALQRSQGSH